MILALPPVSARTEYHLALHRLGEIEKARKGVSIRDPRWAGLHSAWANAMRAADHYYDEMRGAHETQ